MDEQFLVKNEEETRTGFTKKAQALNSDPTIGLAIKAMVVLSFMQ